MGSGRRTAGTRESVRGIGRARAACRPGARTLERGVKDRLRKERERGQVLVLAALLMPLFLAIGSIVIDVGNWYVLKRHLQTQVDAAALAGGPAFTGCSHNPGATTAAIQQQALLYAGDPTRHPSGYNPLMEDAADVHAVLNSTTFWSQGDLPGATDWTDGGAPCVSKFLDVKATDHEAPLLWGWIPFFPDLKTRARVEISEIQSTDGLRPLGVPEDLVPPMGTFELTGPLIQIWGPIGTPSQTQALDCGSGAGENGWNGAMEKGCADAYQVYDASKHPDQDPKDRCDPVPVAADCIFSKTGNNFQQKKYFDTFDCAADPNRWDGMTIPPPGDKRWIPLFIVDEDSYDHGGHKAWMIRRFAMFYLQSLGRGRRGRDRDDDAVPVHRELDFLARLVDPPLDRRERDLERLGDLRVREADDVTQEECHLQVGVQPLDGAPDGVDRLRALGGRVHDLERWNVLERNHGAGPALERAQLVEHAVLRHLEEPGREPRAERESRKSLENTQEDLLGEILGEVSVARQPDDVVEDRLLVRAHDDRECTLVAALCFAQDTEIGLWERHEGVSIGRES